MYHGDQDSEAEEDASDGEGGDLGEGMAAAAAAKSRSRSKKASKQSKSWLGCSPGMMLAALIVLMFSAQIFIMLEQFSHSGRK